MALMDRWHRERPERVAALNAEQAKRDREHVADSLNDGVARSLHQQRTDQWDAELEAEPNILEQTGAAIREADEQARAFLASPASGYRETHNNIRPLHPRHVRRAHRGALRIRRRPSCGGRPQGRRQRTSRSTRAGPGSSEPSEPEPASRRRLEDHDVAAAGRRLSLDVRGRS